MRQNHIYLSGEERVGECSVVLVTGIPAAGKSVLAEKLSEDLGIPWFSKDSIKEELYDTIGFMSRDEKVSWAQLPQVSCIIWQSR